MGGVSLQSESGEGRALEPAADGVYQISTAAELREFAQRVNGGETTANAVLTADIDLSEICSEEEGDSWTPIGNSKSTAYNGTFDGNGKTISGLYINNSSFSRGLFGYVSSSGKVQNLSVSGSVSGGMHVGGVVGLNLGTVENCYNIGKVSGTGVGGVVGWNDSGTVKNCYNIGDVSGNYVGGVVGYNDGGRVENCYNTGEVSGGNSVGGVVGSNSFSATVTNCYNTGTVTGTDDYVGGVVGYNDGGRVKNCHNIGEVSGNSSVGGVVGENPTGRVENSYNTGAVSGGEYVGGVVGYNHSGGSVTNSYNTGAVSGGEYVGGVVGDNISSVTNCYNTGTVTGTGDYVGGVVGRNDKGHVTNCYFLKTAGVPANGIGSGSGSARGLTADEFKNQNSFTDWDFVTANTWSIHPVLGRPVLNENREGGDGTAAHPYEVKTADQLETFRDLVNGPDGNPAAHAKLMNNIDLSSVCGENAGELGQSVSWTPIGNEDHLYTGTFDGNGNTIENLYINTTDSGADNQGLFGCLDQGGTVQNLSVTGNVSGDWHVGGVVGNNNGGTVTGCTFSGSGSVSVTGSYYVGGVVGDNSGTVTNCAFSGSVSGSWYVGGVVGYNGGSVENCYNTGAVSGSGLYVGGVVGWNSSDTVENCYNIGKVSGTGVGGVVGWNYSGTVKNCYNIGEVSGPDSVGGVVGENSVGSTVENCYNTGSVSDGTYTGGVVGWNDGANVTNCYFLQTADVNENLSGIGKNEGTSSNVEARTADAFRSGEVAYLLQGTQTTPVWGQSDLNTLDSWPTLVALDKNENAKPVYKVAFISDNTEIEAQYANSGMTVDLPATEPTKEGYTFASWFTESSGGSQWNFSTAVTKNMTLYAQWTAVEEPIPTPTPTPDPEPSGPSTGDSTGWDDIRDELENAENGDQITIDMGDETKVPAEIFESLAGKDVEISFDLGDIQWSVNGADIPTDTDFTDLDLGVNLDTHASL